MGIVTYPTLLAALLMAAIVVGSGHAAGVPSPATVESVSTADAQVTEMTPVLDFERSFGRSWWQVRASAQVLSLSGMTTEWIAKVDALGMRAVFQHDAARDVPFFSFDLPGLSLGGLSRLFRF